VAGEISVGTLKGIITLQDNFSGPMDKVAKALGVSSKSLTAVGQAAGLAIGAITATTAAIVALGTRGADVADVQNAFNDLATAAGASADVMLDELQKGTLGTISNFDLMKTANKALGSGLVKTSADMATMAQGAQLLADRTGKDTKEAFDSLFQAMASGKPKALAQMGLFVDTKVATEAFAASLGKTAAQLTTSEKAQALAAGTLKELKNQLAAAGPATADFGDNIKRAKVGFENFTDQLGVAIATSPVVQAGMDGIAKALQAAFGGTQQDTIKTLMGFVNRFAIAIIDVASVGVSSAEFISNAWNGVKFLFNTIMQGLTEALGIVNSAIASTIEAASKIPGAPDWLKDMAKTARSASDEIQLMSGSFKMQADEALDNASKNKVMFDAIQSGLTTTRSAMVEQLNAAALVQKSHRDTGEAAVESAAKQTTASTAVRDAYIALQQELSLSQSTGLANRMMALEFDMEQQIEQARNLKDITLEEFGVMVEGIQELYDRKAQIAMDSSAEVLALEQKLQEELALANTTGLENRLIEIGIAHENEILAIEALEAKYGETFEGLRALVAEKYAGIAAAATTAHTSIQAVANEQGFQTRAQMEETANKAKETYDRMLQSGLFTASALKAAWEAWMKAKDDMETKSAMSSMQKFEILAQSATTILRSLFGKSKAAAIAAALIDTAAAVVKSLAAYPWPFNLVAGAAAFAAGMVQVGKIRSTDAGFREGTPGTTFQDFGRESMVPLHGREAVVTPAQGAGVASMVGDAIRDARRERGGGRAGNIAIQIGPQAIRDFKRRELRAGFA